MNLNLRNRERRINELSKKNRWYEYVRQKKYLSPQSRETEVKALIKDLRI